MKGAHKKRALITMEVEDCFRYGVLIGSGVDTTTKFVSMEFSLNYGGIVLTIESFPGSAGCFCSVLRNAHTLSFVFCFFLVEV